MSQRSPARPVGPRMLTPEERARGIGPVVAISSFSAFRELDPIIVPVEGPQGETVQKKLTDGGPLRITDFPELA